RQRDAADRELRARLDARRRRRAARPDGLRQQEVRFGSLAGAGWIAPLAAAREPAIHWVELLVGPAVTTGEADYWAELAGEGLSPPSDSFPHLEAAVRAAGPSGFDPVPSLRRLAIPAHWIYGAADPNVPTQLCVESLEPIRAGHDFTWIVVPGMGHALL